MLMGLGHGIEEGDRLVCIWVCVVGFAGFAGYNHCIVFPARGEVFSLKVMH